MPTPESQAPPAIPARQGLSAAEAARRLATEGPNLLPGSAPKSTLAIVRDVVTEPMFLMLLAAGSIYLALGDRGEALFLLGFVFVVIGITLAQERKTQRALESLRDLSAPRALVIRDGQEQRIAGREVVRGDLLVLHEGDRIAADALLIDGQLEVDESLLTGEAVPVAKLPLAQDSQNAQASASAGAPAANAGPPQARPAPSGGSAAHEVASVGAIYASTVVTRGVAVAQVCATAAHTAVGRIGADLAATVEPPSALQQGSRRLVRNLGIGALVLALAQVLLGWWWNSRPLLESLLSGIALAMAILPEEIPVILTVFLALGAWRISHQKVLTRRVTAVEALGAITVLAVDKTGTLTMNRMAVAELASGEQHFRPESASELPEHFHLLAEFAMLATPADPFDPMEKAIQHFGHQWLQGTEHVHDGREPEFEYALSGEILAMTRVFASDEPNVHLLATKGAPEAVADLCHLDATQQSAIRRQVEAMAERGLRVLGVARGRWKGAAPAPGQSPPWPQSQHDFDFDFLGLVALADPPRTEVPAALAECRRAGVRVIMMTGDHPATARAIAQQVGLSDRPEVITGTELEALDDAALAERLRHVDLCARLKPQHKLRLVQLLRASGEVVAMTGDGVNDAPALKAADVGIAMGERGTDVAREAAALVLLDDSFARIVAAIRQGRRIDSNIRKAVRFVFAVHVPIIGLALVPTLLHWPVLLLPVHIVLLELLIDPACSIVFEAEAEDSDTMARAPRPVSDSPFAAAPLLWSVLQGLGLAAVLLGGQAWLVHQGWHPDQGRTVVFGTLVLCVLLLILANRDLSRPALLGVTDPNPWLWRIAAAMVVLLAAVMGIAWLRNLMGLALPGAQGAVVAGCLLALCLVWLELVRLAGRHQRHTASGARGTA
ncbi:MULTISPECIES: cation-translocating P-type ATPase [unclassified Acidovorax]|jgi:Ca2+-transporting ATPase|uniref:cation-translocating P-type ATPase n=4 Tax=Acidovorax TaxID=12916 RepID=UPI000BD3DCC8|nr:MULTISPECIES: cation-translocating P-type ATPase [unclassified Acidovorax]HQS22084.1 cation-translocating P-type ATPase [Acidovorax defluvii]OYY27594.1 MAG: ATPase [Acidovorax sp. 35-64-16]OYZ71339.1 MAG: ATPase [Acidovorax sp. 24-64-9]OZA69887.1 MAG: ATPase [Acidovorax sp. 39-64-12]HQS64325.1 cation-translocating P-type ATPase [Acidovorax defluvii]